MDDALAFGVDRAIILIARGHKRGEDRAAVAAFKAAAAAYAAKPGEPPLRWYVVDDSTPAAVAEAMTARLGLEYERPFVVATDRFWQTERKYLPGEESVPTTRSINAFVAAFRRGELAPVRLGQPRPPRDRVPACSALWEIVTDSFTELVLDPAASGRTDVLVEGYTPRCDSCKALAPRFRMFAALTAKHWPTLRVARFDIYSNDRITEWMPEKWTPSIRLFTAGDDGLKASGGDASGVIVDRGVASHLLQYSDFVSGATDGAGAAAPAPADSESAADAGKSKGVKIVLPSVPELLTFVTMKAARGRYAVSEAMAREADVLEEEAVLLERCYAQVLDYMQVWKAYSDAVALLRDSKEAVHVAARRDLPAHALKDASVKELQARIIAAARFINEEAAAGSVERAMALLQAVADHIAGAGVQKVVEAAFEP